MARVITLALVGLALAWAAGARLVAQAVPLPPGIQVRDPSAPPARGQGPPPVRRIAIGTGVISGTVVAADSGRPMRNARVMLNGSTPPPIALPQGAPAPSTPSPLIFSGGVSISSVSPGGVSQSFSVSSLSRTALTDAQGQFVFSRLAVGQFSLSVSRNQYLTTNYGQKKPGGTGTTIQLADGQQMKVQLQMIRGGVITGQVLGEDGDPVSNAQVRSLRYTIASGVRRLQPSGFAQTDDRGMYRMFGLQPGDYIVSATPNPPDAGMDRMNADMAAIEQAIASGAVQPAAAPGLPATVTIPMATPSPVSTGPPPGYLPVYYPSTAVPSSASVVHIAGGDERTGIDVQIQLVQASTIQGSISNPPPQGIAVQVSLLSDDPTTDVGSLPSTRMGNDGKFTFRTIAPGKYVVFAQTVAAPMQILNGQPSPPQAPPRLDDSQRWWARAPVTVEGQATLTTGLTLQTGRSISGVVLFEMAKPPDLTQSRMTVTVSPPPGVQTVSFGPPIQAAVGSDSRFTLNGVIPGKYILRPQSGGLAKSSIVNGEDTLDFPLDFTGERDISDAVLTVTDKTNGLSGTLTDSLGKPGTDYTIVLASSDERFWTPSSRRVVISRTSTDGRYQFRNLPPGTYLLAAVTELENGAQYDPQFLRSLNGAGLRVTLAEGAQQTQDLRIGR